MKNKKLLKVISAALSLTLVAGMVGCGEKKQEEPEVAADTIKWYSYSHMVRDVKEVFEEVSKYTMEKIGVKVECVPIAPADYVQKTSLFFASREEFDMCYTADRLQFSQNVQKNCFKQLDDLLEANMPDYLKLVPEDYFLSATVDGKIYAVPAPKDNAFQYGYAFREKYVNEYGIDLDSINGIYDIEPWLKLHKENYPTSYPLSIHKASNLYGFLGLIAIADCVAVDIYDETGTVINPWKTDKAKEFFTKMHEWYKAGYIIPDASTKTDGAGFGESLVGFSQDLPYQRLMSNKKASPEKQMVVTEFTEPWVTGSGGSMMAVSQTSKKPEKTLQFINLLNTDEKVRNTVAFGIENKHWIAVGDNHYKYPDGIEKQEDNGYYSIVSYQGNMYNTRTLEGTPDDIWEKYREFDAVAIKAPNYGFVMDATPVKTEMAAVSNVFQEYSSSFYTGAIDPEVYLPRALEELEAAGIDAVIAEAQRQLDEFKRINS